MSSQPLSPELSRAWERYFQQAGGESPTAPSQVLPVVVMDTSPYPSSRPFQGGQSVSPSAGVLPRWGVQNVDEFPIGGGLLGTSGIPRSVAIIDWLLVLRDATVGGDLFVTLTHHNLNPLDFASGAPVADTAPQKDPTVGATRPQLGNVMTGFRTVGAALIGDTSGILPGHSDGLVHRVDGPWVLGPGQILYVERNLATTGITVYCRGRYYPAP